MTAPRRNRRRRARLFSGDMLRVLSALIVAATLSACHSFGRGGPGASKVEIRSLGSGATLNPALRTAIYRRIDDTTADLYFSDLPLARLTDPSDDLADAAGSIIQVHYFLEPSPGNTPIDDTACNVTVRNIVVAPGAGAQAGRQVFGVYGGGGFFFPAGTVGEGTFGGSMKDGTHRLLFKSPGFDDVLGPASIGGKLSASRDDGAGAAIQSRIEHYLKTAHSRR